MLNKIIVTSLEIFGKIIFKPAGLFKNIGSGEYNFSIYVLFFVSAVITFFKSFSMTKQNINFFSNSTINEIMSFFSIPQIKWCLTFLSFILFVFLIRGFCRLLLKECNNKNLILCFLSISSVGILLQILFYALNFFLSQQFVYTFSYVAFIWIVSLSVIAIRNSQDASYKKSIMIYILSSLPVIFIIGLTGLAPFLLWIV